MADHEEQQAALLEQYWDAVAAGSEAPPPDALDASLASDARLLQRELAPDAPGATFVATLRHRIQARTDAGATAPTARRWHPTRRRWLAAGLAAASVAVVVAGGVLLRGEDARPSAAEILRSASAAAASPQAMGVESFEMTVVYTSFIEVDDRSLEEFIGPDGSITSRQHVWHDAPDRRRTESWLVDTAGGQHEQTVEVWDGVDLWRYDVPSGQVTVRTIPEHARSSSLSISWPGSDDIEDQLERSAQCDGLRVLGEETVAGRLTTVVDLGEPDCILGDWWQRIIWVDAETGFVLREELYNPSGDLLAATEVTSIDYNASIEPERFVFTVPPGVTPERVGEVTEVQFDVTPLTSVAEAQGLATFDVRTPAAIPDRFELDSMTHQTLAPPGVHADFVLMTYRDRDGQGLEIWQGFIAPYLSFRDIAPEEHTGIVEIGEREAVWVRGAPWDDGEWDPDVLLVLGVFEGYHGTGTPQSPQYTVLASNALRLGELIAIYQSLE